MNAIRIVHLFAGLMILAGIVLAHLVHPGWIALSGFVGLNLVQWSFTGFCPMERILLRLGIPSGACATP